MNVKLLSKAIKASSYSIVFIALAMLPSMVLNRFIHRELYGLILDHIGYEGFLAPMIVTAVLIWFSIVLEDNILGIIPLILYSPTRYSRIYYYQLHITDYILYIVKASK